LKKFPELNLFSCQFIKKTTEAMVLVMQSLKKAVLSDLISDGNVADFLEVQLGKCLYPLGRKEMPLGINEKVHGRLMYGGLI
jgi:hypothetical protein